MIKKNLQKIKNNKAFVILFAVTISAILLSIALGVTNIAFREIKFGTSAKDSNNAFFAADIGIECAQYYDQEDQDKFPLGGSGSSINCGGSLINVPNPSTPNYWSFVVSGLGSGGYSCAKVTIDKRRATPGCNSDPNFPDCIISKGYNVGDSSCSSTNPNRVERERVFNY